MADIAGIAVKPNQREAGLAMRDEPTVQTDAIARREVNIFKFKTNLPRRAINRRARMKNHSIFDTAGGGESKQTHKKKRP
jgi:hypothetical protein